MKQRAHVLLLFSALLFPLSHTVVCAKPSPSVSGPAVTSSTVSSQLTSPNTVATLQITKDGSIYASGTDPYAIEQAMGYGMAMARETLIHADAAWSCRAGLLDEGNSFNPIIGSDHFPPLLFWDNQTRQFSLNPTVSSNIPYGVLFDFYLTLTGRCDYINRTWGSRLDPREKIYFQNLVRGYNQFWDEQGNSVKERHAWLVYFIDHYRMRGEEALLKGAHFEKFDAIEMVKHLTNPPKSIGEINTTPKTQYMPHASNNAHLNGPALDSDHTLYFFSSVHMPHVLDRLRFLNVSYQLTDQSGKVLNSAHGFSLNFTAPTLGCNDHFCHAVTAKNLITNQIYGVRLDPKDPKRWLDEYGKSWPLTRKTFNFKDAHGNNYTFDADYTPYGFIFYRDQRGPQPFALTLHISVKQEEWARTYARIYLSKTSADVHQAMLDEQNRSLMQGLNFTFAFNTPSNQISQTSTYATGFVPKLKDPNLVLKGIASASSQNYFSDILSMDEIQTARDFPRHYTNGNTAPDKSLGVARLGYLKPLKVNNLLLYGVAETYETGHFLALEEALNNLEQQEPGTVTPEQFKREVVENTTQTGWRNGFNVLYQSVLTYGPQVLKDSPEVLRWVGQLLGYIKNEWDFRTKDDILTGYFTHFDSELNKQLPNLKIQDPALAKEIQNFQGAATSGFSTLSLKATSYLVTAMRDVANDYISKFGNVSLGKIAEGCFFNEKFLEECYGLKYVSATGRCHAVAWDPLVNKYRLTFGDKIPFWAAFDKNGLERMEFMNLLNAWTVASPESAQSARDFLNQTWQSFKPYNQLTDVTFRKDFYGPSRALIASPE